MAGLMWLIVLLPALLFYGILWTTVLAVPIAADDYHQVLDFANQWVSLHGAGRKLGLLLTFQHNEYKLWFSSAVVALQCAALGHVDFRWLILLGNLFVGLIFLVLVRSYRVPRASLGQRALLLLPVALLLFQLQYATTVNWAMGSLQNLTVIFFSLLAIWLLAQRTGAGVALGCVALVLAIGSSGNGFFAAATGGILLLRQRRWRALASWCAVALAVCAAYFTHYNFHSSQSLPGQSIGRSAAHFSVLYALSFLGASVARYESYAASTGLGVVLVGLFAWASQRRYDRQNPAVYYIMLFVLLTAVGVSGIRANLGVAQSLASRYRIYSNLLLLLGVVFLVETFYGRMPPRRQRAGSALLVVACAGFCLLSDVAGRNFLLARKAAVAVELARWEHPEMGVSTALHTNNPAMQRQLALRIYRPQGDVLRTSARLGVYTPPDLRDALSEQSPAAPGAGRPTD